MPAVFWESEDELVVTAVVTPPVKQAVHWISAALVTVVVASHATPVRWIAPASILVTAGSSALESVMESRIVAGQPIMFDGDKVRYRRGTFGLMPEAWGVVEDASLEDSASDFEKRDGHTKIYAAGLEGTVYRVMLTIRMPIDRQMPDKGEQFYFFVRGTPLKFTVFNGVREVFRATGLRMVNVPARHYTDFPDATPREIDDIEVNQDLASTAFI